MRPITAQPGHSESDVVNALANDQFVFADCYTVTPKVGDPLLYTTAQRSITVVPIGGVMRKTYLANKVLIKGLRVKNSIGVEVDEQELSLDYSGENDYQGQLPWAQALLQGRLDGATIRRDRYVATAWGQPWLGGMPMFLGLVSTLSSVGRQSATINVKSELVLLNVQAPRDLWASNCKNTFGDVGCGIDLNSLSVTGTIGSSPTRTVIPWSGGDSTYSLGKIHIDNGDSVTRVRTISRATTSDLYLTYPLDFDPTAGQLFTAFPGCTRTTDSGQGCPKWWGVDWKDHFKGFPFVPVAETAI